MPEIWLKQKEVADQLKVPLNRVREAVTVLSNAGYIRVKVDVSDRRYVLVDADALPVIRRAIFGEETAS
jgi:DNA-binding MarR family transcriptional regulator